MTCGHYGHDCIEDHESHHGRSYWLWLLWLTRQGNGCSGSDVRADLAVLVLILLVLEDNEEGHPGHSMSGGHDHLKGESHFITDFRCLSRSEIGHPLFLKPSV